MNAFEKFHIIFAASAEAVNWAFLTRLNAQALEVRSEIADFILMYNLARNGINLSSSDLFKVSKTIGRLRDHPLRIKNLTQLARKLLSYSKSCRVE